MKVLLIILTLLLFVSCTQKNELGNCVGLDGVKKDNLKYEMHTTNVIIGILFIETIIVPISVLQDSFYCPTGVKK